MNILGLNAYHGDASACVVVDGKLVAAVEEERFTRVKHWAGFPAESVKWCLEAAGLRLSERGNVELVPRHELDSVADRLAGKNADGFYARLGRWFLADPARRAASPF